MDIDEEVARLHRDAAAAQQRQAAAAAGAAQARARADAARDDMATEFGVDTVAAAREKLAQLESQLEAEAAEVRRQLVLSGGAQ